MNVANLNVQASVLLAGVMVCGLPAAVARAETVIKAVAAKELFDPLEYVNVDMIVNHTGALTELAAYQAMCEVSGGHSGTLDVIDFWIYHNDPDWVFSSVEEEVIWDCTMWFQIGVCAVIWEPYLGIEVENPGYLGTETYQASSDAQGFFDIDIDDSHGHTQLVNIYAQLYSYVIDDPAMVGVDVECFDDSDCDDGNECTYNDCNLSTYPCTLPDLCCETTDSCYDPDPPPPQVPMYCPPEY